MARGPRLDAPGALHHVRARGIERRPIFLDDADRENFLARIGGLVETGALVAYAWALMPNHVHLLVRTGTQPLERAMRALLAGYATSFNRRHERAGHLFQNRYKSTLCEDEPYFLQLVQYIHLNPLPSVVPDLAALARYPYTGHSVLLGHTIRDWQDIDTVLQRFEKSRVRGRLLYENFVARSAGESGSDLEGGGLVRSSSGWSHVEALRKGRERFSSDERILGTQPFVERVLQEMSPRPGLRFGQDEVIALVCRAVGIDCNALTGAGRAGEMSRARRGISYLWTMRLGGSGRDIARRLALNPASVYAAAKRGREEESYWSQLLQGYDRQPDKT